MSESEISPALPPSMGRGRNDNTRNPGNKSNKTDYPEFSIGPALPPHLMRAQNSEQTSSGRNDILSEQELDYEIGPALPLGMARNEGKHISPNIKSNKEDLEGDIGPLLPPHLIRRHKSPQSSPSSENLIGPRIPSMLTRKDTIDAADEEEAYGPSLPPAFTSEQSDVIGPSLPLGFRKTQEEDNDDLAEDCEDEYSEEELIGPMPPSKRDCVGGRSAAEELEARALAMKNKLTKREEDVVPTRGTWMTELPEFSKSFGMGPRTFRKNARPDEKDRSGWTETPADRARKQQRMERASAEELSSSSKRPKKKKDKQKGQISERDKRLGEIVNKHNEKARSESLMDIHSKNRKRKMEEEGSQSERRPFDRDTDLQVNRFDEARRKQILKKSAHLGEKFSHSTEKMYL